jgi:hypothetical protein
MYLTITQNSALYLAQHKPLKRRSGLFLHLRAAGGNQSRVLREQTLVDANRKGRKEPCVEWGPLGWGRMNTKPILFLSCLVAVTWATSVVTAGPRGNNHFTRSGQHWGGGNWGGGNWGGNWHHHHHDHFNDVTFIGGFGGFPFWGWGWGYPYGYYGYGYPYGYGSAYGYDYNNYYGNYYGGSRYGNAWNGGNWNRNRSGQRWGGRNGHWR